MIFKRNFPLRIAADTVPVNKEFPAYIGVIEGEGVADSMFFRMGEVRRIDIGDTASLEVRDIRNIQRYRHGAAVTASIAESDRNGAVAGDHRAGGRRL